MDKGIVRLCPGCIRFARREAAGMNDREVVSGMLSSVCERIDDRVLAAAMYELTGTEEWNLFGVAGYNRLFTRMRTSAGRTPGYCCSCVVRIATRAKWYGRK